MTDIRVGEPDIPVDAPAHTPGVRQGNHAGLFKRQPGHRRNRSTARRSTGINARARNPILPGMPNLSPA